ncbi:TPA: carbon storage regulator CsrA, partial [Legionella pneumophila subsp. pneumophila]|nr:carbon storage regulator CsrA [Legionella pneumophila subsp. pneumophila]
MLILTRRIGETVVVGDDVFITILGIKGNQIRLGFDAPDHVSIHRQEIYLKVQE